MSGNTENQRRQVFVNSNLLNLCHEEARMGFGQKDKFSCGQNWVVLM